jgi:hypothetical protein
VRVVAGAVSDRPLQVSDMSSSNHPEKADTDTGGCLSHGRRGFVDCFKTFSRSCTHVILELREVFKHDAIAATLGMTPEERLKYHRQASGPVMERLRAWFDRQFDEKLVEPNSPLGQAIAYMLRHWQELTVFLRVPGAPLTNNDLEREFKPPQSHLKNSLFYQTERGAETGDFLMSLIQTCVLNNENPFEYLVTIQGNERSVTAEPHRWLPWNWRERAAASRDPPVTLLRVASPEYL